MAYNTAAIKKDVDNKPVPQIYNQLLDAYEVLQGRNGANRVELFDADGNAVDLETLLTAIVTKLTDVAITSSALPTGAATAAKQDTLKTAIDALATVMTAIKDATGIKKITDALPAGTNNIGKVTLDGSTKELRGKAASKPAAGSVIVGTTYWSIDTDPHANAVEVSNGTSWVVI